MNQTEKRLYLIKELLSEQPRYQNIEIPSGTQGQKDLLRSLMNVRMPAPLSDEYVQIESEYLKAETEAKGITRLSDLTPIEGDLYLWQGDITTLECDAIVNAANSQMLGCFQPLHNCEDNCVHSAAGLRLRNYCNDPPKEILRKKDPCGSFPPGDQKGSTDLITEKIYFMKYPKCSESGTVLESERNRFSATGSFLSNRSK